MSGSPEDRLATALREQGLGAAEVEASLPAVRELAAWRPAPPSAADTDRLLAALAPHLSPATSWTRAVLARRPRSARAELEALLGLALSQATLLHAGFWAGSAVVMAVGVLVAAAQASPGRTLVLGLAGPLLAYLGTAAGFRGAALGVLEFELACPVTPRQLTVARLLVIVGYQVLAGVALSWPLTVLGDDQVAHVTMLWLAPLLLAAGLTLLLSLRLPVAQAGGVVYAGWAVAALLVWRLGAAGPAGSPAAQVALAAAGLVLLVVAVARLPAALPRLLDAGA